MTLSLLKSGSDIRGNAIETTTEKINLTDEAVYKIVQAFARELIGKKDGRQALVAIGHDSRLSAQRIKNASIQALIDCGCKVLDCGLCSTPSMFMMTKLTSVNADGAVMITASHHPFNKNGLKFFTKDGGLSSSDISRIVTAAEQNEKIILSGGSVNADDYFKHYIDFLLELVRQKTGEYTPLKGFKIVVDAGNGAGGFYAHRILAFLGASIEGSQYLEPDGNFPFHSPNPEDSAAMASISECVIKNKADLGLIFDTDVDRAAIVSPSGAEINRNRLIALVSAVLLNETKGAYIVTDSVTSSHLKDFIENRSGVHHRFKRGYKNVIDEAVRLNGEGKNAVIAIETSGHAALKENFFLDDGAYLVTRIIIAMTQAKKNGGDLFELIEQLKEPAESIEARLSFKTEDFKAYGNSVLQKLEQFARDNFELVTPSFEGVRANVTEDKGWFLLRMSVHDPIMPLNIESDEIGGGKKIAKILYGFLKNFEFLECKNLLEKL